MRFVDARNLIGKAFCDYLLTGDENFRNLYLSAEVPEEFENYKRERVAFYETFISGYKQIIPAKGCEEVVLLARALNGKGYYFEAHEVVEKFWLKCNCPEKKLLQAVIQTAIANMHLEKRNLKGYSRMKELALENLKPYRGVICTVEVENLKGELRKEKGFLRF
ncbi:MAG TPA: DUF309 domain-containing protein [Aquifex aeolicus]|uniref:DUF309 domain-containing protein n=1 Tax=Aquifex aeolicus TaxID=63363 RepID=A0A9D0YQL6_AQUAO|nr:DUF309 domain-containing protein [Aquificales bacterium]HIP86099.1 DUF309 domain-containing protein [Aquifex sp.]HIP98345.1 DUF309 domain-containing protein [Aquifex aeolicus]HIQ25765.1 DUF309 domain-containing protein [Aquifex aeolicus]